MLKSLVRKVFWRRNQKRPFLSPTHPKQQQQQHFNETMKQHFIYAVRLVLANKIVLDYYDNNPHIIVNMLWRAQIYKTLEESDIQMPCSIVVCSNERPWAWPWLERTVPSPSSRARMFDSQDCQLRDQHNSLLLFMHSLAYELFFLISLTTFFKNKNANTKFLN